MSLELVRDSHAEALYSFGEWTMFVLMWTSEDFEAGRVGRCTTCMVNDEIASKTYKQVPVERCLDCYGTTFEGGYRARLVRPALWSLNEPEFREQGRGDIKRHSATVQSTHDFQMRTGDFLFRADGTRWRMRQPASTYLHHGFQPAMPGNSSVGFIYGQVDREAETSVVYIIPPSKQELATILNVWSHAPPDFSAYEVVRGPLYTLPESQVLRPQAARLRLTLQPVT